MGCTSSIPSPSLGVALAASFGTYSEESAWAEICSASSAFERAKLESPNLVVVNGKGYIFNAAAPIDVTGVLKSVLTAEEYSHAVHFVNRSVARAMNGQPRAVCGSMDGRYRMLHAAVDAAVKQLNAELSARKALYHWDLSVGERHAVVTDVRSMGCGDNRSVSACRTKWVDTRLYLVLPPTEPAMPIAVAPSKTPSATVTLAGELSELAKLHDAGGLTDEEWALAKHQMLSRATAAPAV